MNKPYLLIGRDVKMTDMNSVANKVMQEFYRSCLGKKPTFKDDKISVGAVYRDNVFSYFETVIDEYLRAWSTAVGANRIGFGQANKWNFVSVES